LTSASMGFMGLSSEFIAGVFSIVIIDIVLAGDNAVVIAMAAKSLPKDKRRLAIVFGSLLAVALRIVLTVFAAQLLQISLVKLVGGLLIIWIGVKLLVVDDPHQAAPHAAGSLLTAIWIIIVADVTMSLDNVLALAGASKGDPFLLIFGLILSIPLVVGASGLLANLMDRYPVIIYLGAAVLGKVGAELIMGDPLVTPWFHPTKAVAYFVQACFAVGVIVAARIILLYMKRKGPKRMEPPEAP
jgi:YjbE family integral membrane protein